MYTMAVDSNALRQPGLREYFLASRHHAVALSDLTIIEMHKKKALATSRGSTAILNTFSDRVYVIRRTDAILDLQISNAAQTTQLFDYEATYEFRRLCSALQAVPSPPWLASEMLAVETDAQTVIQRLHQEASTWEATLTDICGDFSARELTEIRTGRDVSQITVTGLDCTPLLRQHN